MGDRKAVRRRISTSWEREQFAALYEAQFPAVYGYLCRRVGRIEGEELTGRVFALALRDRDRFDARLGTPRAWLFGIAANVVRSHARNEARQLRALARTGCDELLRVEDDVVERIDASRETRTLALALARLHTRDREVILLAAWADLTSEEIGYALGIPAGTVRSRLYRARRHMRATLDNQAARVPTAVREAHDG